MDCQIKYSLLDTVLKEQKNHKNLITAVKINNVLRDVQTQVTPEDKVEFIDMTTEDGVQAYQRSILFIMMAAVNMLYPDKEVVVEHSVNNGIYCELLPKGDLTLEMVGIRSVHLVGAPTAALLPCGVSLSRYRKVCITAAAISAAIIARGWNTTATTTRTTAIFA